MPRNHTLAALALVASVLLPSAGSGEAQPSQGRVHPKLVEASAQGNALDVIVFVLPDPEPPGLGPKEIQALHGAAIDEVSEEIRNIERAYRPERSLRKEDEAREIEALESRMSDAERTRLEQLRGTLDERLDTMRKEVARSIRRRPAQGRASIAKLIRSNGGTVHRELAFGNAVAATIPSGLLPSLAAHPLVAHVAPDRPGQPDLDVSTPTAGFGTWWNSGGLDGGVFDAGIVDSGVQQNHPAFAGLRFFSSDGSSDGEGHGTHVAGIIASGDATFRGGAFGLDAIVWRTVGYSLSQITPDPLSGLADDLDWMAGDAGQTPEVVNVSYSWGVDDDEDYDGDDRLVDSWIGDAGILITKSAGNNGWSDTKPTLGNPAAAYNPIVVANMNDRGTVGRADDVRSLSSSVGPTTGGRKKPDIAAPGNLINSTNNRWAGTPTSTASMNCLDANNAGRDFVSCSGTSMAAPHVAAAVVMLADGGNVSPVSQKAVLLNTATAWSSNGTESTSDDGPVDGSLWDKSYGWGYLDMASAYHHRTDFFLGSVVPNDNANDPDDYKLYKGKMFAHEKATLVWQKRGEAASSFLWGAFDGGEDYRLTNLDLRLYSESDGHLEDSDFDGNDNVHQVAPDQDLAAVIKVYASDTAFSGASSESFALATEENFQAVSPPAFTTSYTGPTWINPNMTFDVKVQLRNVGGVAAQRPELTLGGVSGLLYTGTKTLASIPGGSTGTASFKLQSKGLPVGTYYLPIKASSLSYDEVYTYSKSSGVKLQVEATPPTASCTAPLTKTGGAISVGFTATDTQSGIANVFLFVRKPGAASFTWSGLASPTTSGTFSYSPTAGGGLYQFAIQSVDKAGNWDNKTPSVAECKTTYYPFYATGLTGPVDAQ